MTNPTAAEAIESLHDHIVEKATAARRVHGDLLPRDRLLALLSDERFVRFPVQLVFDIEALEPGEVAWMRPRSANPREGYDLVVHPALDSPDEARNLAVVAGYQLVVANYGDVAGADEAEVHAATLLGEDREQIYNQLCAISDRITGTLPNPPAAPDAGACACHGGTGTC